MQVYKLPDVIEPLFICGDIYGDIGYHRLLPEEMASGGLQRFGDLQGKFPLNGEKDVIAQRVKAKS